MDLNPVPLTDEVLKTTDRSVLIDEIAPGEVLFVSFGFVDWNHTPGFDFFGRLKKLEAILGRRNNRLLVRDVGNAWYHRGVEGLGTNVDEVAEGLDALIREISPPKTVFLGQSMGAYAAVMFGALIGTDQVVAFGPLSTLDPAAALLYHDRRWLPVMEDLQKRPPPVVYADLPSLCRHGKMQGPIDIVFGTKPDAEGTVESVNLDALHAHRLAAAPNVRLHPVPESDHTVVKYLADNGLMDDLLIELVYGSSKGGGH
jgi:pimeloyl-ACP methyl ester carboxylesterase